MDQTRDAIKLVVPFKKKMYENVLESLIGLLIKNKMGCPQLFLI